MQIHQTELALHRRLEDLTNELAYMDQYPERMPDPDRIVRKIAVVGLIRELRTLQLWWACPIEQYPGV